MSHQRTFSRPLSATQQSHHMLYTCCDSRHLSPFQFSSLCYCFQLKAGFHQRTTSSLEPVLAQLDYYLEQLPNPHRLRSHSCKHPRSCVCSIFLTVRYVFVSELLGSLLQLRGLCLASLLLLVSVSFDSLTCST